MTTVAVITLARYGDHNNYNRTRGPSIVIFVVVMSFLAVTASATAIAYDEPIATTFEGGETATMPADDSIYTIEEVAALNTTAAAAGDYEYDDYESSTDTVRNSRGRYLSKPEKYVLANTAIVKPAATIVVVPEVASTMIAVPTVTSTVPTLTTTVPTAATSMPIATITVPTAATSMPISTITVPTIKSMVPTLTTTIPIATTTVPIATTTVPTITSTVPITTTTVPTATTTVPTATTTVPTATSTVPTVTSTVPTVTSTVPTVTSTVPIVTSTIPIVTSTVPTATIAVPLTTTQSDVLMQVASPPGYNAAITTDTITATTPMPSRSSTTLCHSLINYLVAIIITVSVFV